MGLLDVFSRQTRQLRKLPLLANVDAERWDALMPHLDFVDLDKGETLFSAGHRSEELFMVVDGQVGLFLTTPDATSDSQPGLLLQRRNRGETIGDFSVLSGGEYPVHCRSLQSTRVASLARAGLELLIDIDPELLKHFYQTAADLSRQVMLANVFIDLFEHLDEDTLAALLNQAEMRHYQVGDVLFRTGDDPDGLYAVVSGRLTIERTRSNGETQLAEVYASDAVGELALVTDRPRGATAQASRESTVAFVPRASFQQLLRERPALQEALTRLVVRRHVDHIRYDEPHSTDRTFVCIPLDDDIPLKRFQQQLRRALRPYLNSLLLDAHGFDTWYGRHGASQTEFHDLFNSTIGSWLDDKENRYDAVVYIGNPRFDAWTRRCLNRADRVLLLANGDPEADAELREHEHKFNATFRTTRIKPRTELILIHAPDTAQPEQTARWLSPRRLDSFHHVRLDDRQHFARLARRLCGRATALVQSGGGARGYAHLGVQDEIERLGIEIDYIGGASMGALLGATMAMGHSADDTRELSRSFANRQALFDYTLPLASLMKSGKLTRFCRTVYRKQRIEDLWIPFFCVSTNMSTGEVVVHEQGELWRAVRSSISIPGLFSPVPTDAGQLLIDGGVLANFPTDIMKNKLGGAGTLIGSNVGQAAELWQYYNYGTELSGWEVLWTRIMPHRHRLLIPSLAETLLRSNEIRNYDQIYTTRSHADVLIEPDVRHIALLDFKSYQAISEIGRDAAREVFERAGYSVNQASDTNENSMADNASQLQATGT